MPKKTKAVDELILKYVPLKTVDKWDRNKKKHDIPAIVDSLNWSKSGKCAEGWRSSRRKPGAGIHPAQADETCQTWN
jgi:hypothetical protein